MVALSNSELTTLELTSIRSTFSAAYMLVEVANIIAPIKANANNKFIFFI